MANTVRLYIGNIWTRLDPQWELDHGVLRSIEAEMSYTISEYVRFRKCYVDFSYSLFNKQELKYPTGLFSRLIGILNLYKIEYEIYDERESVQLTSELPLYDVKLRDYQNEAVEKAVQAERGVIKVATGGGKSTIAVGIMAKINVKTLFIVNSLDLLEQAYDEFTRMLRIDIGRIGGGQVDVQKINVCTIQTLHNALGLKYEAVDDECYIKEKVKIKDQEKEQIRELVKTCEMIIVDETQHSRANSYVNMMESADRALYKIGLSATPYKMDSTDIILDAYAGREIINVSASYLIDRGFLVQPKIYFLDPNLLHKYKYVQARFPTIYNEWIVRNKMRNNLVVSCAERLMELDKTVLITVTRIEHGEILLEMIEKNLKGVPVAFIQGEVDKDTRKKLLNEVRKKELKILIGTSLSDEGLDLPALDSAIIAGGGKSLIKTLQRVGRTLRPFPNAENNIKKEAIVVDFYDHIRYLTSQSVKRMAIYKEEPRFEIHKSF